MILQKYAGIFSPPKCRRYLFLSLRRIKLTSYKERLPQPDTQEGRN
jgi:hypothetical protein